MLLKDRPDRPKNLDALLIYQANGSNRDCRLHRSWTFAFLLLGSSMPSVDAVATVLPDLAALAPVRCPCGWARRAFGQLPEAPASLHLVEIVEDARTHYHRLHTEIYYVLECGEQAAVELDGKQVQVQPGSAVHIPPGVRHRAVGRMKILNFVVPPFDPADEWFD